MMLVHFQQQSIFPGHHHHHHLRHLLHHLLLPPPPLCPLLPHHHSSPLVLHGCWFRGVWESATGSWRLAAVDDRSLTASSPAVQLGSALSSSWFPFHLLLFIFSSICDTFHSFFFFFFFFFFFDSALYSYNSLWSSLSSHSWDHCGTGLVSVTPYSPWFCAHSWSLRANAFASSFLCDDACGSHRLSRWIQVLFCSIFLWSGSFSYHLHCAKSESRRGSLLSRYYFTSAGTAIEVATQTYLSKCGYSPLVSSISLLLFLPPFDTHLSPLSYLLFALCFSLCSHRVLDDLVRCCLFLLLFLFCSLFLLFPSFFDVDPRLDELSLCCLSFSASSSILSLSIPAAQKQNGYVKRKKKRNENDDIDKKRNKGKSTKDDHQGSLQHIMQMWRCQSMWCWRWVKKQKKEGMRENNIRKTSRMKEPGENEDEINEETS